MLGSVLGGRWSDRELRRLTRANGGHHSPEVQYPFLDTPPGALPSSSPLTYHTLLQMRLESTKPAALFLPLACIAYAWLAQKHAHVAALCIALFLLGFCSM